MSQTESDLLVSVEHVKYRQNVPGKSPLGTMSVYKDRVEWTENGKTEVLLSIPYSDIKIQRISPPNRDKIQLQIRMHNEDQATFVFMRPGANKEALIADRDLIKETIQQNLIHYRHALQESTVKAEKEKNDALEAKKKYLQENKELQTLYRFLVSSKLISPEDFWSLHHIPTTYKDQLGISSGFLSSINQTGDSGGIHLNLTMDTIRAIFKTYPVVEKKHLEMVPHVMTEQEFWTKFFQSHYFHRERDMNEDPNDPFYDCDKNDRKEMIEERSHSKFQKLLDFGYLLDDFGIASDIRQNFFTSLRNDEDEDVDRLVRRCNYHSGRLLSTLLEKTTLETFDNNQVGTSHVNYKMNLESEELAEIDKLGSQTTGLDVSVLPSDFESGPSVHDEDKAHGWKAKVLQLSAESACSEDFVRQFFDDLTSRPPAAEKPEVYEGFYTNLKSHAINELKTLYPVTHELLRHFWVCLPAKTPEAKEKLKNMHETLIRFENLLLTNSSKKVGYKHTEHLFSMIKKAKQKYAEVQQSEQNST